MSVQSVLLTLDARFRGHDKSALQHRSLVETSRKAGLIVFSDKRKQKEST
jgi:hypothetical protein